MSRPIPIHSHNEFAWLLDLQKLKFIRRIRYCADIRDTQFELPTVQYVRTFPNHPISVAANKALESGLIPNLPTAH